MRKALVKTYIYELIFLCIYLIVMNKLLEIFEEKFILGVFIILIINVVVFFYLIIYLIIYLRSQYYVYKLNLSKSIMMEKKLYKMKKINSYIYVFTSAFLIYYFPFPFNFTISTITSVAKIMLSSATNSYFP